MVLRVSGDTKPPDTLNTQTRPSSYVHARARAHCASVQRSVRARGGHERGNAPQSPRGGHRLTPRPTRDRPWPALPPAASQGECGPERPLRRCPTTSRKCAATAAPTPSSRCRWILRAGRRCSKPSISATPVAPTTATAIDVPLHPHHTGICISLCVPQG